MSGKSTDINLSKIDSNVILTTNQGGRNRNTPDLARLAEIT